MFGWLLCVTGVPVGGAGSQSGCGKSQWAAINAAERTNCNFLFAYHRLPIGKTIPCPFIEWIEEAE